MSLVLMANILMPLAFVLMVVCLLLEEEMVVSQHVEEERVIGWFMKEEMMVAQLVEDERVVNWLVEENVVVDEEEEVNGDDDPSTY